MRDREFIIGIDTSNYKTSLALTNLKGDILFDSRKSLIVKQGERGLRQSHALFQHMNNLPQMIQELFQQFDRERIVAVAASDRPRPLEGSYMPVFKAGMNYGSVIASSLGIPFFFFSHQEGHIEAVKHNSRFAKENELLTYHLSGGTCELLHVKEQCIDIIGGSKDISFGQVLDRIGVFLGMEFPAGDEMDKLALKCLQDSFKLDPKNSAKTDQPKGNVLKKIPMDGLFINLSGLETQSQRELEKAGSTDRIILELFQRISEGLCRLTEKAIAETRCNKVLFAGGVSASKFIKHEINRYFEQQSADILFGDPVLSSDNAIGISFLGGKQYGDQTN